MRRTQLYLDEGLWSVLHTHARREGTTISDLVRQAARQRYMGGMEDRCRAMQALVGIRKDRADMQDSAKYVRSLRQGSRLERLQKQ